jgi:hypothetical protein
MDYFALNFGAILHWDRVIPSNPSFPQQIIISAAMLAAKHHQLLAFMEAFIVLMLYSSILFIASLFTAPGMTHSEESLERYWSGKPQAIGIDLSASLLLVNASVH